MRIQVALLLFSAGCVAYSANVDANQAEVFPYCCSSDKDCDGGVCMAPDPGTRNCDDDKIGYCRDVPSPHGVGAF